MNIAGAIEQHVGHRQRGDQGGDRGRIGDVEVMGVQRMARDRGFIVPACDIRALALVVQGLVLGLYLSDIDKRRPSDEELLEAILLSIDGFLVK
jgi:hypothetical protein